MVKVVLVCSNGYLNQQLVAYFNEQAVKNNKVIRENMKKFICIHTPNGNVDSLKVGGSVEDYKDWIIW